MPVTATPITIAEPKITAPDRTVTDSQSATVAATTAMTIEATTRTGS